MTAAQYEQNLAQAASGWDASPISTARLSTEMWNQIRGEDWSLVSDADLIGDHRQLQAVGRGGLFAELCATGRPVELVRIHRFTQPWEAAASLQLRDANPAALDTYQAHDRISGGELTDQVTAIAEQWMTHPGRDARWRSPPPPTTTSTPSTGPSRPPGSPPAISPGRRWPSPAANTPTPATSSPPDATTGNWSPATVNPSATATAGTCVATHPSGALTVSHREGHGTITLPADYVGDHVRLGYAATEHGNQGDTVDIGLQLVSPATTRRGLYVGATRGRHDNHLYVVTDDLEDPRDVLEAVLYHDRADRPAVTQRRELARTDRQARPVDQVSAPGWIRDERARLVHQRDELRAAIAERAQQRHDAEQQRRALQPELDAARAAWAPHGDQIRAIETELNETSCDLHCGQPPPTPVTPGSVTAAPPAGPPPTPRRTSTPPKPAWPRHGSPDSQPENGSTPSNAKHTTSSGSPIRTVRLAVLGRFDSQTVERIDRLVHAIDTWADWASGGRVKSSDLDAAVAELLDAGRHWSPGRTPNSVPAGGWTELAASIDPSIRHDPEVTHRCDHERGIEIEM